MIELRGITWAHPRGLHPLVATAEVFTRDHPDVRITWDTRSLHAFTAQPLDELVRDYDLVVIDYPFVGAAAQHGYLLPLDTYLPPAVMAAQSGQSVGASHRSYRYGGHQWALAIDAGAQVSAYRPDLRASLEITLPRTWTEVLALARQLHNHGRPRLTFALDPANAMATFLTLCANHGEPPCRATTRIVSDATARFVFDLLQQFRDLGHPEALAFDAPGLLACMSESDEIVYSPLVFGHATYARSATTARPCRFMAIPTARLNEPPRGALLGGAGLAVSAQCRAVAEACAYTQWVASAECQRTVYVAGGGQPGHRSAWIDPAVNAAAHNFFLNTLQTLDLASMRPRYSGFPAFFDAGAELLHNGLRRNDGFDATLMRLNALYADSRARAGDAEM